MTNHAQFQKKLESEHRTFIIAEAGVNHNGDIEIAKKLVDIAKRGGADCIKFQTFFTEEGISAEASLANYQIDDNLIKNQIQLVKKLELSSDSFAKLKNYAENVGLIFLSTPFDLKSVELLEKLNVQAYKISSGDLTNKPLLLRISETKKPLILSTGMANLDEIKEAIGWLTEKGCKFISLMQCTSCYPTKVQDANLLAIKTLKDNFDLPVGFSDHTIGSLSSIMAIALKASFIEKHITPDHTMNGPDHSISMEPDEFQKFVKEIRNAELALGIGKKVCLPCEEEIKQVGRKSLVTLREISAGSILQAKDVGVKRPGTGISPKDLEKIIGKKVNRDLQKDTVIQWKHLND